ncbi:MAG: DUF2059 domain-containing protein [Rhizobiaceae bacterium]|nr:DUF2059 domain-containing protein [Rhizobiaceae bacterium]
MSVRKYWSKMAMRRIVGKAIAISMFVAASFAVVVVSNAPLQAQEISEEHIAAAKKAISATSGTEQLNGILPAAADNLAGQLIASRPDLEAQITDFVNESALELAPRRGDLEKEVAMIYARVFSEEELLKISEFFSTTPGQKFLTELPLIIREMGKASNLWGTGINRDLSKKVQEKLDAAGLN